MRMLYSDFFFNLDVVSADYGVCQICKIKLKIGDSFSNHLWWEHRLPRGVGGNFPITTFQYTRVIR